MSLATAVPNYLYFAFPLYGHFGFYADRNWVVQYSNRPLLKVGDIIDWRALPLSKRYDTSEFGRLARPGTQITFPVMRNGVRLEIPLVSEYHRERFLRGPLWPYVVKKSSEALIVFLGAALVLMRPSRLSWLFFLYAASLACDGPSFWSFLPTPLYEAFFFVAAVLWFAVPPVALLLFALHLRSDATRGRALLKRGVPYLFGVLATLWIAEMARDQFAIAPTTWLFNAAVVVVILAWTLAGTILIIDIARALRDRVPALGWVCAALTGSALCYMYVYSTEFIALPDIPSDYLASISLLLSLAAVYVIMRGRIIDVRFVITRAALSAAIGYAVVAAFALLNLLFANSISHVAFVIPLEIVVAVLFGFWLSGLRDVAATVNLTESGAKAARLRGDRSAERDSLARALARAERTRNATLIATVRAQAAFGAWFAGEGAEFETHAGALDQIVGERSMQGLRRFAKCATSHGTAIDEAPERGELPEWISRTHLVACGASNDAVEAKRQAASAIVAADASADPFLRTIARIALAEFSPAHRSELYEQALTCCQDSGTEQLCEAVRSLSLGRQPPRLLEAFVNTRLRAPRAARPMLDVRFADGSVRAYGVPVKLRPRESSLLFSIAESRDGASFDALADGLWPDLDGDGARTALRVTLHRLRRALGDDAAIVRGTARYRLREGAVVDLWEMKRFVDSVPLTRQLSDEERKGLTELFHSLRLGRLSRPIAQEWFSRIERTLERLTREAGNRLAQDALERRDPTAAATIAAAMMADDPLDEKARELAILARLQAGDHTGALQQYRDYRDAMARASLGEPSGSLAALVASAQPVRQRLP